MSNGGRTHKEYIMRNNGDGFPETPQGLLLGSLSLSPQQGPMLLTPSPCITRQAHDVVSHYL